MVIMARVVSSSWCSGWCWLWQDPWFFAISVEYIEKIRISHPMVSLQADRNLCYHRVACPQWGQLFISVIWLLKARPYLLWLLPVEECWNQIQELIFSSICQKMFVVFFQRPSFIDISLYFLTLGKGWQDVGSSFLLCFKLKCINVRIIF